MTRNTLSGAIAYEARAEKTVSPEERPGYHFSPRIGWMNDPNGFSFYGGEYHLFYQYYPYGTAWGPMHWGHAVSRDLVRWDYLPAAMAPDRAFDSCGCFSGTAGTAPDGRHMLLYTGVSRDETGREFQQQCVALGDGRSYTKYEGNPVIGTKTLPGEINGNDFRDPKLYRTENGYRCIAAARCAADRLGVLLQYESADGLNWRPLGEFLRNSGAFGLMWECPDCFPLDGHQVVLVSTESMLPAEGKYASGNGTVCFIGELNGDGTRFLPASDQPIDFGPDFYAPQTLLTPDGRRIMIAWLQNWDAVKHDDEPDVKWFGQMTVCRELSIRDGRLLQQPVRELEALRTDKVAYTDVTIEGDTVLPGVAGRCAELIVTLKPEEGMREAFSIHAAENERFRTVIRYEPESRMLTLDRSCSGSRRSFCHVRSCRVEPKDGKVTLRILIDRFSIEVFAGGGEQAMTMAIRTEASAEGISFHTRGSMKADIEKYRLAPAE